MKIFVIYSLTVYRILDMKSEIFNPQTNGEGDGKIKQIQQVLLEFGFLLIFFIDFWHKKYKCMNCNSNLTYCIYIAITCMSFFSWGVNWTFKISLVFAVVTNILSFLYYDWYVEFLELKGLQMLVDNEKENYKNIVYLLKKSKDSPRKRIAMVLNTEFEKKTMPFISKNKELGIYLAEMASLTNRSKVSINIERL